MLSAEQDLKAGALLVKGAVEELIPHDRDGRDTHAVPGLGFVSNRGNRQVAFLEGNAALAQPEAQGMAVRQVGVAYRMTFSMGNLSTTGGALHQPDPVVVQFGGLSPDDVARQGQHPFIR